MRPLHFLLTFLAAVAGVYALSSCATLTVHSDVNTALIASVRCHTFSFAGEFRGNSPLRGTIANPVNEARLRDAIAARLTAAGAQQVQSNPECLVGYGIGAHRVIDGVYPAGWAWGWPGYGPWGWYGAWGGPMVYHEGVVAVDLYDAASRQAIWHASVDQSLYNVSGPEAERRIHSAVEALFARFPARTS
jgi:hypothetical protein